MYFDLARSTRPFAIEPLEARIAPASVFTYIDVDGDLVTIKSSVGTLGAGNLVFEGADGGPQQLQQIVLDGTFTNTALAITVKSVPGGDGRANVGAILADGVDLKSVSVAGDLGRIEAGSADGGAQPPASVGLGALTVDSLGRAGVSIQGPGGSLFTSIGGNLGKLTVKGDIFGATLFVDSTIGSITIGGSLIGGAEENSALIFTGVTPGFTGNIGAIKIGGGIHGGAGDNSGQIFVANGTVASLTVGGDIAGGTGNRSGWVSVGGSIGAVQVKGSILGNAATDTNHTNVGGVMVTGTMKSLTVGGDIIGGAGQFGGYVLAIGAMGAVKIGGDVRGDSSIFAINNSILTFVASFNGGVQSATSMGKVLVNGSVVGGFGHYSGVIFVGNEDLGGNTARPGVNLAGDPDENDGLNVGLSTPGTMGTVTIKGSLVGGGLLHTFPNGFGGAASGWIKSDGAMGAVKVNGDLVGAVGPYSGTIQSRDSIASVSVLGSLRGGQGFDSGSIFTGSPDLILAPPPTSGILGAVKIGGSLISGTGNLSGTLYSDTMIKSVSITGSIIGDVNGDVDGAIAGGGAIVSNGSLGPIVVKGSVRGEFAPNGGGIYAFGGNIASVNIGRDLTGSTATTGIYATGSIGAVTVGGSVAGAAPGTGTVFILSDTSISKLTVKGRVENADILAGSEFYNFAIGAAENADAQIGSVTVSGDWITSNLAAGVNSTAALFFGEAGMQELAGNNLDATLAARIASIVIAGNVYGTPESMGNGFGFFAQQFGSFKIRGVAQKLTAEVDGVVVLGDPALSDVRLNEFGGS